MYEEAIACSGPQHKKKKPSCHRNITTDSCLYWQNEIIIIIIIICTVHSLFKMILQTTYFMGKKCIKQIMRFIFLHNVCFKHFSSNKYLVSSFEMCAEMQAGLHLKICCWCLILIKTATVSRQSYKQKHIKSTFLLHRLILLQIFYYCYYYYYYYYY